MNVRRHVAGLLAAALIVVAGTQDAVAVASNSPNVSTYTQAESPTTYGVYVKTGAVGHKVTTVSVPTVESALVYAKVSPNGEYIAFVPDFDNRFGTRIVVVRVFDGKEVLAHQGYIADFIWSDDSQSLVYVAMNQINAVQESIPGASKPTSTLILPKGQIHTLDLTGKSATIPTDRSISHVLGLSEDKRTLYVTRVEETESSSREAFAVVDARSGALRDVFLSPGNGRYYRSFKLVDRNAGEPWVSFVAFSSMSSTDEGENKLVLARLDGTIIRETLSSTHRYLDYVWAKDGEYVTMLEPNGVWVAREDGTGLRQVASGSPLNWSVDTVTDLSHVTLRNHRSGLLTLTPGQPLPKSNEDSSISIMAAGAVNLYAPYIHQTYDTATALPNGGYAGNQYNGGKRDGCGPTSAVIVMAALGRYGGMSEYVEPSKFTPYLPKNPNEPAHWSTYGGLISKQYTANWINSYGLQRSFTFSDWDYAHYGQGTLGYLVKSTDGTSYAQLDSFLTVQDVAYSKASSPTLAWVKQQLDLGRLIIASHTTELTFGHLSVIKGYNTDSYGNITSLIWHDTYGNAKGTNGWGWNDGADVSYNWTFTNIAVAWAVYLP